MPQPAACCTPAYASAVAAEQSALQTLRHCASHQAFSRTPRLAMATDRQSATPQVLLRQTAVLNAPALPGPPEAACSSRGIQRRWRLGVLAPVFSRLSNVGRRFLALDSSRGAQAPHRRPRRLPSLATSGSRPQRPQLTATASFRVSVRSAFSRSATLRRCTHTSAPWGWCRRRESPSPHAWPIAPWAHPLAWSQL